MHVLDLTSSRTSYARGAMARSAALYAPGTRIPGTVYEVVGELARGGMGAVYDVEDVSIGKRYVLKTLLADTLARDELTRRMAAEARILAQLSHPNIVDVITAGITQDEHGVPYFVMERLNGRSLQAVLAKKERLDVTLACRIGIDVLDALQHAHDNGVVHRDVKPANIFLHRNPSGTTLTKLLDFGVMRLADSTLDETRGQFIGTLAYAAPEQVSTKTITPATDLFAAGLVLYEMAAGRGPWAQIEGAVQRAYAHAHEPAPPLSQWLELSPEFERLIMSALSKDPEARPRDASTFAHELRKILASQQDQSSVTSAPTVAAAMTTPGEPDNPLSALDIPPSESADGLDGFAKTLVEVELFSAEALQTTVSGQDVPATVPFVENVPFEHGGHLPDFVQKAGLHYDTNPVEWANAPLPAPHQSTTSAGVVAPLRASPRAATMAIGGLLSIAGIALFAFLFWRGTRAREAAEAELTAELPTLPTASIAPVPIGSQVESVASAPALAAAAPSSPATAAPASERKKRGRAPEGIHRPPIPKKPGVDF